MSKQTIPALPPEIWHQILCLVPPETLHNVTQTCHYLHEVATSERLFQHHHQKRYNVPREVPLSHSWRDIYLRTKSIRRKPETELFYAASIVPIIPVADSLLVHMPEQQTLHALPHTWSLDAKLVRGSVKAVVALTGHCAAFIDSELGDPNPRLHILDTRTGELVSHRLPQHQEKLSCIPGRKELVLPAENFEALLYYPGVLRVVKLSDLSTIDIPSFDKLILGESSRPLIEGYATADRPTKLYSLRGEFFMELPVEQEDKLLTIATNAEFSSFTARIHRQDNIVALSKSQDREWYAHLYRSSRGSERSPVHMFYNGNRKIILPSEDSSRTIVIHGGDQGDLQMIRAFRTSGGPYTNGFVCFGGDIVALVAEGIGVVSFFDLQSGSCIRSTRFEEVDKVFFVGGAWIVGFKDNLVSTLVGFRFGVGKLLGFMNQLCKP